MNLSTDLLVAETAQLLFHDLEYKQSGSMQSKDSYEEVQGRIDTIKELLVLSGTEWDEAVIKQQATALFLSKTGMSPLEAASALTPKDDKSKKVVSKRIPAAIEPTEDVIGRIYAEFPYFCKMVLEIAYRPGLSPHAPDGGFGPMVLNQGQRKVAAVLLDQWLNDIPVRVIILKSRQLGVTTLLMAFWLWLLVQNPGLTAMIIIDKGDHLNEKRQIILRWLEKMTELFPDLPGIERRGSKVLELKNMSRFLFESAEAPNPGTSEHISILHCSEKPKWPRGRDRQIDASIVPGLPEKRHTIYVDESTAEGVNGFYYRWHRVVEGKADATPLFHPWYISDEYKTDPPEKCYNTEGNFIYINDDVEISETDAAGKILLTEEEFSHRYELSPAQTYWRRSKIKNAFSGDRAVFDQEYPTSPRHAWQMVGGKFFSFEEIEKCQSAVELPILTGNLVDNNGNNDPLRLYPFGDYQPSVVPVPYGSLAIRVMPEKDEKYYIGGDIAEGKQSVNEAGATDYDYTVFVVKDSVGKTVALFRDRIKPEEAALPLLLLACLYNNAMVNCERNGPGQVVWSMFKQTGYYNIYYTPGKGPILDRAWTVTTASNRHPMLYALRASYRENPERPGFKELVAEMNEIIIDSKGKIQARKGAHDDIIIAESLCWNMIYIERGVLIRAQVEPEPKPVLNEFAAAMAANGIERW